MLQAQTVPALRPVSHPSHRMVFACVSAAYLLFILAGTLVPFDFAYRPFEVVRADFGTHVFLGQGAGGLSDLAANLVLFLPLAFCLLGALSPIDDRASARVVRSILVFSALLALAVGLEFVQAYSPSRSSSWTDVIALTAGGGAGIAAWWLAGRAFATPLADIVAGAAAAASPLQRLAALAIVVIAVFYLWPFDLTMSPVEVYHKWKAGRLGLIPFASTEHWGPRVLAEFGAIACAWAVLGALAQAAWPRVSRGAVTAGLALYAVLLEGLKVFVLPRTSDSAFVIIAVTTAAAGAWWEARRLPANRHAVDVHAWLRSALAPSALVGLPEVLHPWTGACVYLSLLFVAAFWPDASSVLRQTGAMDVLSVAVGIWALAWAMREGRLGGVLRHPLTWLLILVAAAVCASAWYASDQGRWNADVTYRTRQFVIAITMFFVAACCFVDRRQALWLGPPLALIVSAYALSHREAVYLHQNVAALAAMVVPALGLLLSRDTDWRHRVLSASLAAFMVHLVVGTRNRGGLLALAAACIVALVQSRRALLVAVAAVPVVGSGALLLASAGGWTRFLDLWTRGVAYGTAGERLRLWNAAWRMWRDYPWLGVGPGNYQHFIGAYATDVSVSDAHSHVMAMIAETGLPATVGWLLLFASAFLTLVWTGWRVRTWQGSTARWLAAGIAAWFVAGLFLGLQSHALAFVYAGSAVALANRPRES